jgi:hypothetical protein
LLTTALTAGVGDEFAQFLTVFAVAATCTLAAVDRYLLRSPMSQAAHRRGSSRGRPATDHRRRR